MNLPIPPDVTQTAETISDEVCLAAINLVFKPLGTSLQHYMPVHKAAIEAMRGVLMAVRDEERERCAKIADDFADENMRMAQDTILLDPVLASSPGDRLTAGEWRGAEELQVDGTIHSSMHHAAKNIAEAIRARSISIIERTT